MPDDPTTARRDDPEDMFTPEQNFARNKSWAAEGNYNTPLPPAEEDQFRAWLAQNNVLFDPDEANPDYDMRGFWKAKMAGDPRAVEQVDQNDVDPQTGQPRVHRPDFWKTPYDATFSNQSQWALPNAPTWDGDQYKAPDGHVIYDDQAGKWYGLDLNTTTQGQPPPVAQVSLPPLNINPNPLQGLPSLIKSILPSVQKLLTRSPLQVVPGYKPDEAPSPNLKPPV